MPALDGIPVPPHARRRQSPTRALAPRVPDDRQSVRRYPCVYQINRILFHVLFFVDGRTDSVRSYVLAGRAWKWYGYGAPRRAGRGGSGNG